VLGAVALVVLALSPLDSLPANPFEYAGGLLGAFIVAVGATAVRTLGVLRLGVATVAGPMAGALIVDLVAPAPGEPVTVGTVIGVALTMAAVGISGRGVRASASR
jgi:bacterial/archaeal transporter family-2 protein